MSLTRAGKWKYIKINKDGIGESQYLNKAGEDATRFGKRVEEMTPGINLKKDYKLEDPEPPVIICDYLDHNPMKRDSLNEAHVHKCNNDKNITKRCGFNSAIDGEVNCPLYSGEKGKTKVRNVIKPLAGGH